MSFILGLTGGIGMGKSTTSAMFSEAGAQIWDADAAVHRLYAVNGAAVAAVERAFPGVVIDGTVRRELLRSRLAEDPSRLSELNAIVHPLVAADRQRFLAETDAELVVLDIPLLFESGAERLCDAVATVSVPPELQRERVLARGLTEAELDIILARQLSDAERRSRADFVIPTGDLTSARQAVSDILAAIRSGWVRNA